MTLRNNIKHFSHQEIDAEKWNACISQASNGLPYAHTSFLNAMCPGWCALVAEDYTAVMPLPCRKKFGIAYLYQPFLTPALGVFAKQNTPSDTDSFLAAIPAKYRLWDLTLNAANETSAYSNWAIARTNYVLPLRSTYSHIAARYHQNIRRSLQKAAKEKLIVKKEIPVSEIISICVQQYPLFTKVEASSFDKVALLCAQWPEHIITYGVYNQNGLLLASCACLLFKERIIYWLAANRPESRSCGASALLVNQIVQDYAGRNMVLDFEGSDDAGVAMFYQRFGAVPERYTTLYRNRLPYPISLLKKMPVHYRQLLQKNQSAVL